MFFWNSLALSVSFFKSLGSLKLLLWYAPQLFRATILFFWASLVAQTVKNPPGMQDTEIPSRGWEYPLEKGMATHPSILDWKINPMDRGAWKAAVHGVAEGRTRQSDFTFHFHALEREMAIHSSVLAWRNPRDGGAWWAAVCGVTQSWTRLKWLSSSSRFSTDYKNK